MLPAGPLPTIPLCLRSYTFLGECRSLAFSRSSSIGALMPPRMRRSKRHFAFDIAEKASLLQQSSTFVPPHRFAHHLPRAAGLNLSLSAKAASLSPSRIEAWASAHELRLYSYVPSLDIACTPLKGSHVPAIYNIRGQSRPSAVISAHPSEA